MPQTVNIGGPYFEDFVPGQEYDAPCVTLSSGHAAWHQAVTGDRLRLALDQHASQFVTGVQEQLAHPMLVANIAIGQSTEPSQRVKGNLFYRGLVFFRPVSIGDTLCTRTSVVGLRQSQPRPGKPATGLVVLEVETRNQNDQQVLHFWRCPLIPCRDPAVQTRRHDNLDGIGSRDIRSDVQAAVPDRWRLSSLIERWSGRYARDLHPGDKFHVEASDIITSAPELVRLTLNMAVAHTDSRESYLGRRLVYGGHTLSLAFAQLTRALPNLITMLGWESCQHSAPVMEGDRICSDITVIEVLPTRSPAFLIKVEIKTMATGNDSKEERLAVDWIVWLLSL